MTMARSSSAGRRKGDLARLAQRVLGQPLMIDPRKAEVILGVLGPRLGLDAPAVAMEFDDGDEGPGLPVHAGGVAIIPVHGTLVQRSGWLDAMSGVTSYETLRGWVDAAMADQAVKSLVLDIDSGGGEVAGCFDFVDHLYGLRGRKPIVAVANEAAYSAAYAIASAADQIWLTRTAGVGSVGVIAKHVDRTAANAQAGRKVTTIFAGPRKADLDPDQPLTDAARDMLQTEVDRVYGIFAGTAARNRGMSVEEITALESGVRFGPEAVAAGLADKVGTLEEAVADHAGAGLLFNQTKEGRMAKQIVGSKGAVAPVAPLATAPAGNASTEPPAQPPAEGQEPLAPDAREPDPAADAVRQAPPADPAAEARQNAAAIAGLCSAAGVPAAAEGFIRDGMTAEQVKQRLADAAAIRTMVATAGRVCRAITPARADAFIAAGTPAAEAGRVLWAEVGAANATEISSHRTEERPQPSAAGNHGWDKAVAPYVQPKK